MLNGVTILRCKFSAWSCLPPSEPSALCCQSRARAGYIGFDNSHHSPAAPCAKSRTLRKCLIDSKMLLMGKKQRSRKLHSTGEPQSEAVEPVPGRSLTSMARTGLLVRLTSLQMRCLVTTSSVADVIQPASIYQGTFCGSRVQYTACTQALGGLLLLGYLIGAFGQGFPGMSGSTPSSATPSGSSSSSGPQLYSYDLVDTFPHDPDAFTQGLDYDKVNGQDVFWESTGTAGACSAGHST